MRVETFLEYFSAHINCSFLKRIEFHHILYWFSAVHMQSISLEALDRINLKKGGGEKKNDMVRKD